jgi:hypothetical protein
VQERTTLKRDENKLHLLEIETSTIRSKLQECELKLEASNEKCEHLQAQLNIVLKNQKSM